MSALGSISIKTKDGVYKNYTISIVDETNEFGQNISMFEEQTKEQRLAGEKRKYIGNGKVFWTDGNITKAEAVEKTTAATSEVDSDLPF